MSDFTAMHKILATYADTGAINYVVRWNMKVGIHYFNYCILFSNVLFMLTLCLMTPFFSVLLNMNII